MGISSQRTIRVWNAWKIARGQKPFAAILTCGDSRTDPDFMFDMAPGNLFVVRNAGNVLESVGLGRHFPAIRRRCPGECRSLR